MERILSTEEKIRRAEEIYNRRQSENYRRTTATVNVGDDKKEIKLFKRMFIQICVCLLIYAVFYVIDNKEYIFSEAVLQKSREVLSYDINLSEMYKCGKNLISSKFDETKAFLQNMENEEGKNVEEQEDSEILRNDEQIDDESTVDSEEDGVKQDSGEDASLDSDESENSESIGGAVEEETSSSINQMEIDANEIKETISLIKPLEGTITSRFGVRNPTVSTVSTYHTGIDIAAATGTKIKSATSGVVELASSEGDYR